MEQEQRVKSTDAKRRRAERSTNSRGSGPNHKPQGSHSGGMAINTKAGSSDYSDDDMAYLQRLMDICPRCGFEFEEGHHPSDEELSDHLTSCNDAKKHKDYQVFILTSHGVLNSYC